MSSLKLLQITGVFEDNDSPIFVGIDAEIEKLIFKLNIRQSNFSKASEISSLQMKVDNDQVEVHNL